MPHLKNTLKPEQDTLIAIGPEGDFSPEEVTLALSSGFQAISLGEARLRTETAGLYAVTVFGLLDVGLLDDGLLDNGQ
jgi:16S rRNA (uracil1498-N3)-methyltransferase